MKKHIPRDVFENGACVVADAYFKGAVTTDDVALLLWEGYKDLVVDDGVLAHWSSAGGCAAVWLEINDAKDPEEFLHHFQWYVLNFDEDDQPRKEGFLKGLIFTKSEPDEFRVEHFLERLKKYYFRVRDGKAPLAPPGWEF